MGDSEDLDYQIIRWFGVIYVIISSWNLMQLSDLDLDLTQQEQTIWDYLHEIWTEQ